MDTYEQVLASLKAASEELEVAEERARRIMEKYFATGIRRLDIPIPPPPVLDEAARRELQEAWDDENKALQAYREARERF